jgi:hypothetical protein
MPTEPVASPQPQDVTFTQIPGIKDYNSCFCDLTADCPVAAVNLKVSFIWYGADGSEERRFDVFPYDPTKPNSYVVKNQSEGSDVVADVLVRTVNLDKYNFFRQLSVKKIAAMGGNTISLQLIDPSGFVLEEKLLQTYLQALGDANKSVVIQLYYGWDHGEDKGDLHQVGTGKSYMLYDISVQVEYTGASYTLEFGDAALGQVNTKPQCWMKEAFANLSQGEQWTLPQAITGYWRKAIENKANVKGKTTMYLMRAGPKEEGGMPASAWTGGDWVDTKMEPNGWVNGDLNYFEWVMGELSETPDKNKKYYFIRTIPSGKKLLGKVSDYQVYFPENASSDPTLTQLNSTDWKGCDTVMGQNASNADGFWIVPEDVNLIFITESKEKTLASALNDAAQSGDTSNLASVASAQSNFLVGKKYKWLAPDRDVHGTIINFTIQTSSFYSLYVSRNLPKQIPVTQPQEESQHPKDPAQKSGEMTEKSQQFETKCSQFGMPAVSNRNSSKPATAVKGDSPAPTEALYLQEATASFIALEASIQVIGDPDLELVLYNCVQIDFDTSAQAMLPWTKGTYLVLGLEDTIAEGIWLSTLQLFKVGGLSREAIEASKTEEGQFMGDMASTTSSGPILGVTPMSFDFADSAPTTVGATTITRINSNVFSTSPSVDMTIPTLVLQAVFDIMSGLNSLFKDPSRNGVGIAVVTPEMAVSAGYSHSETSIDNEKNLEAGTKWFYRCFNEGSWTTDGYGQRMMCTMMAYRFGAKPVMDARKRARAEGKFKTDDYSVLHPYIVDEVSKPEYGCLGQDRRSIAQDFIKKAYTESYLGKYKGEPLCRTFNPDTVAPVDVESNLNTTNIVNTTPTPPVVLGIIDGASVAIRKPAKENYTPILYIKRNITGANFEVSPGDFTLDSEKGVWTWFGISPTLNDGDTIKAKVRNLTVPQPVDSKESSEVTVDLKTPVQNASS